MKGDDRRAAAIAAYLDGRPLGEEVDSFAPAVRELIATMDALELPENRASELVNLLAAAPEAPAYRAAGLTIQVADLDTAVAFYRDGLGFKVAATNRRGVELDGGGWMLCLRTEGGGKLAATSPSVRLDLRVSAIEPVLERLRSRGFAVRMTSRQAAECRDPDGNAIVLREG